MSLQLVNESQRSSLYRDKGRTHRSLLSVLRSRKTVQVDDSVDPASVSIAQNAIKLSLVGSLVVQVSANERENVSA